MEPGDPDIFQTFNAFYENKRRNEDINIAPDVARGLYNSYSPYEQWMQIEAAKYQRRQQKRHMRLQEQKAREREEREAQRKREREEAEEKRKREREEERERQNPTPVVQPITFPTDIPLSIRNQHIFIPGATRHGKSSHLLKLIMADINLGKGVAVLDPKSDLVKKICVFLPVSRFKDCIYLDLKTPIPLDIMHHAADAESLVGDIKALVLKGDTSLKRAEPILTRLVHTLLKIPDSRFTDIEDIFTIPRRKKEIMLQLEQLDPARYEYWKNNWPSNDRWEPLVARMTDFTENRSLKTIMGDPNPRLNLRTIMDHNKIVLVDLGGTGEVREIYGALLVSRFQQAAFSRTDVHERQRIPFSLFVDEFENFQTSSFAKILSVAGGLGLHLAMGNQYVEQLAEDVRHAVINNTGSFIIFKLQESLQLFRNIVYPYDYNHLGRLPKYQAVHKIGDLPPIFKWTTEPLEFTQEHEKYGDSVIKELKAATLRDYGPTAATYATKSTISTVDKPAGNTTENVLELENGGNADNPNLLSKRPEEADTSGVGGVLRPHGKRPRKSPLP